MVATCAFSRLLVTGRDKSGAIHRRLETSGESALQIHGAGACSAIPNSFGYNSMREKR
jgi:hypothetical protein